MDAGPYLLSGSLSYPAEADGALTALYFSQSGNFTSLVDAYLNLTGSGTVVVPFGTVAAPGAKVVSVEYEVSVGAAPVLLRFNGSADSIELAPGGVFICANPAPVTGITGLSLVHTTAATLRVHVLG